MYVGIRVDIFCIYIGVDAISCYTQAVYHTWYIIHLLNWRRFIMSEILQLAQHDCFHEKKNQYFIFRKENLQMHSSLRSSAELKRTINFREDFYLDLICLMCNYQKKKKALQNSFKKCVFQEQVFQRKLYILIYLSI